MPSHMCRKSVQLFGVMLEYCSEEVCIPVLVLRPQLENFCLGDFLFSYDLKRIKKQE